MRESCINILSELLAFDEEYTLEISGELTDVIGKHLDGNADGVQGDGISP